MKRDVHYYEPASGHGLPHDPFNAIIGPRPIGWISSIDTEGRLNLAPYSFFNGFNYQPPIIGFSSIGWKDSVRNIEQTREFAWNLATHSLAVPMNQSSATVEPGIDEFALAGLTPEPSRRIRPPRVAETPVSMECRLIEIVRLHSADRVPLDSWLVLGEVVAVHIDKALLKDGVYQTAEARPILRAGGPGGYARIEPDAMFDMRRPR
jgi:flavin reductase (DIM6/NTAB) family NADH-FMN oxidoreductase RutF